MATTVVSRNEIERLLNELEPQMRDAFLEAIADITDEVVLNDLVERIAAGDIDGAIQTLQIAPPVFSRVADVFYMAYLNAGNVVAGDIRKISVPKSRMPRPEIFQPELPGGGKLIVYFNVRNPQAEQYLRTESSRLVTGLTDVAKESVRVGLSEGMTKGQNPRKTALDVVGRISKKTGRREGGVVGLSQNQVEYVNNARDELLSGDPVLMERYLGRMRRDARFDAKVRRAIAAGKPVSADDVMAMVGRYADRLLQLRGETIARTETILALHAGQEEAMRQAIETGKVDTNDIVKIWRSAKDGRVRDSHIVLDGKKVGFSEYFISPATGSRMLHPGDRNHGALPEDVINCRCHAEYKVDYIGGAARQIKRLIAA